jgi:hypothetical protein
MFLAVKKIKEDFVLKNYPELLRAVSKIEGLTDTQREKIYGLCIDIAFKSEGNVNVFYTEFGDELVDPHDMLEFE